MIGWRRVARADIVPQSCAVLPQLGAAHAEGYIDVGVEMVGYDPHTYISCHAARLLGEFVGLKDPEPFEQRIAELERELADLRAQRDADEKFLEAAEYSLARFGQKVVKKPGRKPGQEVAA